MIRLNKTEPYTGPFPRAKHYHRCPKCFDSGSNGVNCYKAKCTLPRDLKVCGWCGSVELFSAPEPAAPWPAPEPSIDPWCVARAKVQLSLF